MQENDMTLKVVLFLTAFLLLTTSEVTMSSNEEMIHLAEQQQPPSSPAPAPSPSSTIGSQPPAHPPAPKIVYVDVSECPRLCVGRCAKHSRPNHCHRVCGTCCVRCKCVPPGTYGNREMCGTCYADMRTHNNETKCP